MLHQPALDAPCTVRSHRIAQRGACEDVDCPFKGRRLAELSGEAYMRFLSELQGLQVSVELAPHTFEWRYIVLL